jgi:fluoride exporter
MESSSSARGNALEGNRLGYARSASMDSMVRPSLPARSSSQLSRRSSRQGSTGSISLSREMGDSILSSMRHSLQSADQLLGDADSSVLAQLIDSGDRVLAPEDDFGEDTTSISDHHKVGPLPEDATMNNNGKVAAAPTSSMDSKYTIATVPESSSAKVMITFLS